MRYAKSLWEGSCCKECKGKDNVKEIEIGEQGLFLCKSCREQLADLLKNDKKEGELL